MTVAAGKVNTWPFPWRLSAALQARLLCAVLASCVPSMAVASTMGGEADSATLRTLIQAREMYALVHQSGEKSPGPMLGLKQKELVDQLQRLAEHNPTASSIRRLSLMQFALGDERWRSNFSRLTSVGGEGSPFEAERELSMWRSALGGEHISPVNAMGLVKRIRGLKLGWYEHVALEAVYSNAGMDEDAASESAAALRSSSSIVRFLQFQETLGRIGIVVGAGMAGFLLWRRRHPLANVPAIFQFSQGQEINGAQSQGLYGTFLLYLASYAAIQFASSRLFANATPSDSAGIPRTLWSLLVMAIWVAVPYLYLRKVAKRTDLTRDRVGFRSSNILVDILWGIGGYVVAIPLVWLANGVSQRLFASAETPLAPVLSNFAGSKDQLVQILLFSQAVLIAPIIEETLFRGVLFKSLQFRMSWTWAMLVTAAIFALLHPQMPVGFLGLFVLGIVFNALYALRGSLLPCVVAHSVNNAMIFASLTLLLSS